MDNEDDYDYEEEEDYYDEDEGNYYQKENEEEIEENHPLPIQPSKTGQNNINLPILPNPKKKKNKKKKKKTPQNEKKQQQQEILPNNKEIVIREINEEIKSEIDFSPIHNSNLISWVQLKDCKKNLSRSYASSVLIKDLKGNLKIFLNGKIEIKKNHFFFFFYLFTIFFCDRWK